MSNNKELRSINEILGWKESKLFEDTSNLVQRVQYLCKIPLSLLQIEDLRLLINQEIALEYTIPAAIDKLSINLFAEGDFYQGDLLKSVLTINNTFWENHSNLRHILRQMCKENVHQLEELELPDSLKETLKTLMTDFAQ